MKNLIISFISPDRPGIVDELSKSVKSHQGNWQTSSLHHLSGYFTGVIELSIESDKADGLIDTLLSIPNFKCNIETTTPPESPTESDIVLELTANDRVGIVQEISSVIHHHGGNLLKLVSGHEGAAHSGQDLFKAKITIAVDEGSLNNLVTALEGLADDLMVDITR